MILLGVVKYGEFVVCKNVFCFFIKSRQWKNYSIQTFARKQATKIFAIWQNVRLMVWHTVKVRKCFHETVAAISASVQTLLTNRYHPNRIETASWLTVKWKFTILMNFVKDVYQYITVAVHVVHCVSDAVS